MYMLKRTPLWSRSLNDIEGTCAKEEIDSLWCQWEDLYERETSGSE